jgi:oleate hydratase
MEAVYTLLDVDRGVPEVFGSAYDVRVLMDSTAKMMDGKKLTEMELPPTVQLAAMTGLEKISRTRIMQLLKEYKLI